MAIKDTPHSPKVQHYWNVIIRLLSVWSRRLVEGVLLVGFTLLYFKIAMIPLVPETKMVDVGKLISLGNLSVRKVTWFVLRTFDFVLRIWSRPRIAYIYSHLPRTRSLTFWLTETEHTLSLTFQLPETALSLSLFISTSSNSLTLPLSKTQFNTRNKVGYTLCNLFLPCSAFSVWLVPASDIASEISSNPERDKQPKWEKTRSF